MGEVVEFPGGPCKHQWDDPPQPVVDAAGTRYVQCWKCGERKTEAPVASPGTTPGLPEYGYLPGGRGLEGTSP